MVQHPPPWTYPTPEGEYPPPSISPPGGEYLPPGYPATPWKGPGTTDAPMKGHGLRDTAPPRGHTPVKTLDLLHLRAADLMIWTAAIEFPVAILTCST